MTRLLPHAAFAVGLIVVAWIGAGYLPGNPLALLLVGLIGAFYLMGALELRRFQQATGGLAQRLAATTTPPPELGPWLAELPAGLRNAVRLRVEGERVALPGPALTPYLAGLLVLLGMLGTFLGMVVTLKGTGLALENAADVEAIRASLAAPIKGLGLAFGTSVAGVAASAMLGLMSALARRERQRTAQRLDAAIATTLRVHSRAHQREESLRLMGLQAQALPALVAQVQALVAQMELQGPALAQQIDRQGQALQDSLLAGQARFQTDAQKAYGSLADSVGESLKASLAESARLAGEAIEPAVQATLAGLARQASALHERLNATVQRQLEGVLSHLQATTTALLAGVAEAHAARDEAATSRENERIRQLQDGLASMAATLHREGQQAGAAMAAVVGEMRRALSDGLAHDNAVLEERNRLMATLAGLLDAVNHAGTEQRAAIDALVQATTDVLGRAGSGFTQAVEAESRTLREAAAQATASAAEVASLGEGFGLAVQLFSRTTEQLSAQLQRIESALGQSMARSDEQMAYYVAQAREIIDLTLGSQKQIVDDLQQLGLATARQAAADLAPADAA